MDDVYPPCHMLLVSLHNLLCKPYCISTWLNLMACTLIVKFRMLVNYLASY